MSADSPVDVSELSAKDIEELERKKKADLSWAVSKYIAAEKKFEEASSEFNKCCCDIRQMLCGKKTYVIAVSYQDYLFQSDEDGNFEVTPIERLY